jgi:hypothetical protein
MFFIMYKMEYYYTNHNIQIYLNHLNDIKLKLNSLSILRLNIDVTFDQQVKKMNSIYTFDIITKFIFCVKL